MSRTQAAYRQLPADDRRECDDARAAGLSRYRVAALVRALYALHRYDLACVASEHAEAALPAFGQEERRWTAVIGDARRRVQALRAAPRPARAPQRRSTIGTERGHYLHRVLGAVCRDHYPAELPEVLAGRVLGRPPVASFALDLDATDEDELLAFARSHA